MAIITAVAGGIGSGKSVVCKCLQTMGYLVYDCDSRAKALMDGDDEIKRKISEQISSTAIDHLGRIDRKALAAAVFADKEKLTVLNSIVHSRVREDIVAWANANDSQRMLFVETAILYQSGLDKIVDAVWEVTASEDIRIDRVCKRNGLTPNEVKARINSQRHVPAVPHPCVSTIVNDGHESILRQINSLLHS